MGRKKVLKHEVKANGSAEINETHTYRTEHT
jgi:hypothetical protein